MDGLIIKNLNEVPADSSEFLKSFRLLGHLNLDEDVTPESVPGNPGYYITSSPISDKYTGVYSDGVFLVFSTPANNQFIQMFLLREGHTFMRKGNSGKFYQIDLSNTNIGDISSDSLFLETHESVYVGSSGELEPNENYNVHDFDVSGLDSLTICCKTTLYGSSTCWAFLDSDENIISVKRSSGSGKHSETIVDVIPKNCTIFRVTEHIEPLQVFSFNIINLAYTISSISSKLGSSSDVIYSCSPTDTISGSSDSNGGALNLYLPYSDTERIRVCFIHSTRPTYDGNGSSAYHNGDCFRLDQGIIGTFTGNTFTPNKQAITSGAWESAIYKDNGGSAVGTFHGWEKFSRCIIQVDGKIIADMMPSSGSLPSISMSHANTINIFYWGTVYELPPTGITTETKLLDVFRKYCIKNNTIEVEQRFKWVPAGTHGIFIGMGCVSRSLTDHAFCDYDYALHNVANGQQSSITSSSSPLTNVTYAREYGQSSGVAMTIEVNPPCNFYIQNSAEGASYNKMYFRYVKETEAGESWNTKTKFILG